MRLVSSLRTSARSVPAPAFTVTANRESLRSRPPAPVKRTLPANSASRACFFASYVPSPRGKRKSAPPSWAPPARVHFPWPIEPVTYSRKVRRTPQSTAASSNLPGAAFGFALLSGFWGVFDAAGFPAGAEVSTERLTGSSGVPAV